jgi:propanol-preferring alcohol dehydrogenase
MELAAQAGVRASTRTYVLDEANNALKDLREGKIEGAAVLVP